MSEPVYMLEMGYGWSEAWYQLSKEEQDELWAKVLEIDKHAGAKWVIACNSRWADVSIYDWGVLEYPSMEAYQQKVKELEKLDWYRYFKSKSILGTKMDIV